MKTIADLEDALVKARQVRQEAEEHYQKNPEDYSAQLILLSTENYISDLLRQLDVLQMQKNLGV